MAREEIAKVLASALVLAVGEGDAGAARVALEAIGRLLGGEGVEGMLAAPPV